MASFEKLVSLSRGRVGHVECVESEHCGAIVIVDGRGQLVSSLGDPEHWISLRSTAKPFQLLPFLLLGLQEAEWPEGETISDADLALMMSSHAGEPMHVERVRRLLALVGLSEDDLRCGEQRVGQNTSTVHNNCSGKHTALLMICRRQGWPIENYLHPDHPLQHWIARLLLNLSGRPIEELGVGVDGCSLPTYILSLSALARLYASLACPEEAGLANDPVTLNALSILFRAGTSHPEFIGGAKRLDTTLIRSVPGLFAKTGAEGVFAMGYAPSERYPQGLGIAIKVTDGDSANRARTAVAIEVLRQLQLLPEQSLWEAELASMASDALTNLRGIEVGRVTPTFALS